MEQRDHHTPWSGSIPVEGASRVANLFRVTPFMHVPDIDAAVHFFTEVLGFHCFFRQGNYAYVQREAAAFRLFGNSDDDVPSGNRRVCYYIDVSDVDAVFEELRPKIPALNDGDVYGPVNQIYGQRELMVMAPDGNLLVFGQDIAIKRS